MAGHDDAQRRNAATRGRLPVPPGNHVHLARCRGDELAALLPRRAAISRGQVRVAIDGGPGAEPDSPLAAWLVTDERAELIRELRGWPQRTASAPRCAPATPAGWRSRRSP